VASDTKDGIITLTGHVRTWAEHDAVVGAAWMALGPPGSATNFR
jgi:osmotically-inducible protein OsmY